MVTREEFAKILKQFVSLICRAFKNFKLFLKHWKKTRKGPPPPPKKKQYATFFGLYPDVSWVYYFLKVSEWIVGDTQNTPMVGVEDT